MLNQKTTYGYNDVIIAPAIISEIQHRYQCNPFCDDGFLPIFTAPMSTVVNEQNFDIFEQNHIHAIMPRNINLDKRMEYALNNKWAAFSLQEFENLFCNKDNVEEFIKYNKKVLIDVANGHMKKIYDLVKISKELYNSSISIMIGNIANPLTYVECVNAGVDYVRLSIGSGSCCITSSNLGVHYGIASLIDEVSKIKLELAKDKDINSLTKIVADGGIRNYSDVIKALALGADFVMIGGLLASLVESAGKTFIEGKNGDIIELYPLDEHEVEVKNSAFFIKSKYDGSYERITDKMFKICYGMASKDGQISINGEKTKTSEGITKTINVTTNIDKWTKNMIDYIKSAMSYLNMKSIKEMNQAQLYLMSPNLKESINK
ncbi:MAG: IMP dehydrogenase [Bacilli bacterium]|nr:IMP dehydrogenase [Bacilli bacterium]